MPAATMVGTGGELTILAWSQILPIGVGKDQTQFSLQTGQPPFLQRVHDQRTQRNNALARFRFRLADLIIAVGALADMKLGILRSISDPAQAA